MMNNEVLIRVEKLKKKYCRSLKRSMVYGISDICRDIVGMNNESNKLRKDEFWSLSDISFEVKRGECLGIIGANGAGKSTLLKLLNGIILPDSGKIMINGTVSSLIEVGAGFHPMLSGRENIYINGSILGMSKTKIDQCFDSIVEFSELEDSIDMPVKHYSSGMYVRLGFAIAAHVNPDILILDEVLAVGDIAFVAKCFKYISSIKNSSAIILVSHEMRNIARICDNVIFLEKGKVKRTGASSDVISAYRNEMVTNIKPVESSYSDYVKIKSVDIVCVFNQFEDVDISLVVNIQKIDKIVINLQIYREDGTHCSAIMSDILDVNTVVKKELIIKNTVHKMPLMPGIYYLTVIILDEHKTGRHAAIDYAKSFKVNGCEDTQGIFLPVNEWSVN